MIQGNHIDKPVIASFPKQFSVIRIMIGGKHLTRDSPSKICESSNNK
jgi:hypothetical protein